MEITNFFKSVVYNTLTQYWYIWVIIILIPILGAGLGILLKFFNSRLDRFINYNKVKRFRRKTKSYVDKKEVYGVEKKVPNTKYNGFFIEEKGLIGENIVSSFLEKLDPEKYRVINDLRIININRETAQIDHLIISNFGIFVIETKNFLGTIYGGEYINYWTQKFNKNYKKNFNNPIKQNSWHIQVLKDILKKYPDMPYFSIVVFMEGADLRVGTNTDVVYANDLLKTIKRHRNEIISNNIKDDIYDYLTNLTFTV